MSTPPKGEYYEYHSDPHAFIFQLTKGTKHELVRQRFRAVFHYRSEQLFGFGGGNDFYISEHSDTIEYSASFFGRQRGEYSYSYRLPEGL